MNHFTQKKKYFWLRFLGGQNFFLRFFWSKIAKIAIKQPSWLNWAKHQISKPHYFGLKIWKSLEKPWFSVFKKHIFARKLTTSKFWGSDFSPKKYDKGGPLYSVRNSQKSAILAVSNIKKSPKNIFAPLRISPKNTFSFG